jgi:TrpR-related protein YerC/YecD
MKMALKKTPQLEQLFRSLLCLKDEEECSQYLEDLCTIKEIESMAQRLDVARMLSEGHSYHETFEQTGASSATISRVKRCLEYGAGGYEPVLERLKKEPDGQ